MRKSKYILWGAALLLVFFTGCGSRSYLETAETAAQEEADESDRKPEEETDESDRRPEEEAASDKASENEEASKEPEKKTMYVQIGGAVVSPGVYCLTEGSRVFEAVAMAGGLTREAAEESLNQAEILSDGQWIHIPTKEEAAAGEYCPGSMGRQSNASPAGTSPEDTRININTATAEELTALPGIGPAKARAIVSYREEHGGFSSPEDLKQVSGIGEGTYRRLEEQIRVQ